ncbi:hypothetical protein B7463_g4813, partial [Scytalidium lignicola]
MKTKSTMGPLSHSGDTGTPHATPKSSARSKRKRGNRGGSSKKREKRQKILNQNNLQSDSDVIEVGEVVKEHPLKTEPSIYDRYPSTDHDEVSVIKREGDLASKASSAPFGPKKIALMQSIFKDCSPATQKRFSSTASSSAHNSALNQIIIKDDTSEVEDSFYDLKIKYNRSKSVPAHNVKPVLKDEKPSKAKKSKKHKSGNFTIEIPAVRDTTAFGNSSPKTADKEVSPIEITSEDGSWYEAESTPKGRKVTKQIPEESVIQTIESEVSSPARSPARSPTIHRFSSFDVSPAVVLSPNTQNFALQEAVRNGENDISDWEVEPGKVRGRVRGEKNNEDAEVDENIAFSSKYIFDRPNGVKLNGFNFQVRELEEGLNFQLPQAQLDVFIRICSVAAGKVQVQLAGEKFDIGVNGMWRVRSDEGCIVSNCGVGTATVHISTVGFGGSALPGDDLY